MRSTFEEFTPGDRLLSHSYGAEDKQGFVFSCVRDGNGHESLQLIRWRQKSKTTGWIQNRVLVSLSVRYQDAHRGIELFIH